MKPAEVIKTRPIHNVTHKTDYVLIREIKVWLLLKMPNHCRSACSL